MYKRSVLSLFIICFMGKLQFRKKLESKEGEYSRENTSRNTLGKNKCTVNCENSIETTYLQYNIEGSVNCAFFAERLATSLKRFTEQRKVVNSHIPVIYSVPMVRGFCRVYTSSYARTFGHLKSFFPPCVYSFFSFPFSREKFATI